MKKLLFIMLLLTSTVSMAQNPPPPGAPPQPPTSGPEQPSPQKFAEHKAKILQKLQEKQACVQAAANHEALKACFPKAEEHEGQHEFPN